MESYDKPSNELSSPTKLYFHKLTWAFSKLNIEKNLLLDMEKNVSKKIPIRYYISSISHGKLTLEVTDLR